jgi:hypothetical protein
MEVKQPLSAEKPAVNLILTKYGKVLRFKSACYTFCVITLYAVGVSTKKFFLVFGKYLWRILFTPKRFSVNFGYLGLKGKMPRIEGTFKKVKPA